MDCYGRNFLYLQSYNLAWSTCYIDVTLYLSRWGTNTGRELSRIRACEVSSKRTVYKKLHNEKLSDFLPRPTSGRSNVRGWDGLCLWRGWDRKHVYRRLVETLEQKRFHGRSGQKCGEMMFWKGSERNMMGGRGAWTVCICLRTETLRWPVNTAIKRHVP